MIFNSLEFIIFFLVVFILFWLIGQKQKVGWLFLASYFFYGFTEPLLVILLFFVSYCSYLISKLLSKAKDEKFRLLLLFSGLFILLAPLLYFKYFNFITQNLNFFFKSHIPLYDIILPVGISFYTFQTAGFVVDVFNKKVETPKFITFLTYVSFFPQLVAGPIERAGNLLPQLRQKFEYNHENFKTGLKIAAFGLFKKIVVADQLATFVEASYKNASSLSGLTLLLATVLFAFQIYCDFSGYSDIAIGVAKMFNIDLMKNFNRPYFASSIFDFWRRWHISLSTWFKDYVYIPLGGNKTSISFWALNIFIVFTISGFWHGAKWTFVVWGFIHGLALVLSKLASKYYDMLDSNIFAKMNIGRLVKFILTFSFVNVTWVFFRSDSLAQSFLILKKILDESLVSFSSFSQDLVTVGFTSTQIVYFAIAILALLLLDFNQGHDSFFPKILNNDNLIIRRSVQYLLILAIILFGNFGESPFIYFQF